MISAGELVQASGTCVSDRTHGVQFKASFLKATPATTIEGIEKYLGSGITAALGRSVRTSGALSMRPSSILAY
jgi:exodeoxyribonuclease V alpha subunit